MRMPVPIAEGRAACAEPGMLDLVDEAIDRPGSRAGKFMRAEVCPACEVFAACLTWAMTHPEAGVWGGTTPIQRTKAGAPALRPQSDHLTLRRHSAA